MDWVTDPAAIKTLVALRGIQVGDEIRLKNCYTTWIDRHAGRDGLDGDVVKVTSVGEFDEAEHEYEGKKYAPVGQIKDWTFYDVNIAAWRRPEKPT